MMDGNPDENVSPMTVQMLKTVVGAMVGGLTLMAGLVVWSSLGAAGKTAAADQVRAVNLLTTAAMVSAVVAIVASEILWRKILRRNSGPLSARVQTAFIVRLACRELAVLLCMTVAYIAACDGVLRAYPAYWVNFAPYALFLVFLSAHWPSAQGLTSEAREIMGY